MVVGSSSTSSSSTSSVSSLTSFGGGSCDETVAAVKGPVVKFLCSYGGRILPRHHDGRLRYVGGDTRVLAVDRAFSFSVLAAKMAELCGWGVPVSVRCQLPTEDLDALISITSDEDLANLLEEYDLAGRDKDSPFKVKAFLAPQQLQHHHHLAPMKTPAMPPSSAIKGNSPFDPLAAERCARHAAYGLPHAAYGLPPQWSPCTAACSSRLPTRLPTSVCYGQPHHHHNRIHSGSGGCPGAATGAATSYRYHNHQQHPHLIHHGNHRQ